MFFPATYRTLTPSSWEDALGMRRDFDRWFDRYFSRTNQSLQSWSPVIDVVETDGAIVVNAELAGVNPADVSVTVQNGVLTINGEKKPVMEGDQQTSNYHLNERRYGRFERSFSLLQSIVADDVRATFANGLLTVTLPKTAEAKPRRIQVEAGGKKVEIGSRETARAT